MIEEKSFFLHCKVFKSVCYTPMLLKIINYLLKIKKIINRHDFSSLLPEVCLSGGVPVPTCRLSEVIKYR